MRPIPLLLILAAGFAGGAALLAENHPLDAAPSAARQEPDGGEEDGYQEGRDLEEIRADLAAARRNRELTLALHELARFEHEQALQEARAAADLAQAELDAFETHGLMAELAASALDLVRTRDEVQDAEEELKQLEQMYGQNELADRTAEIVLSRGERELGRVREALRLAEENHRHLERLELPLRQLGLRRDRQSAQMDVRAAELGIAVLELEQRNELADLEAETKALERELAEAEAAAKAEKEVR